MLDHSDIATQLLAIPEVRSRFSIRRELGIGSYGAVFEADDQERGLPVALKVLLFVAPQELLRFKQEFRALATLTHPNLIRLHELFCYESMWFFTMDLIDGQNLRAYVRGKSVKDAEQGNCAAVPPNASGTTQRFKTSASPEVALGATTRGPNVELAPVAHSFDESRLRSAFSQLACGVQALHEDGKLHCDLKPANVLVTSDDRVLILDFGLISEVGDGDASWAKSAQAEGTPAYMSPEQAVGLTVTPASDWYAVGVMLYEALAGRRPFMGPFKDLLFAKQHVDPPDPRAFDPSLPEQLCRLAMRLLDRNPQRRPSADILLKQLANDQQLRLIADVASRSPSLKPTPKDVSCLFGRGTQMEALWSGFREIEAGRPAVIHVRGMSGFGKSALLSSFVSQLQQEEPHALVLAWRCYEREFVPFKALDGLIDVLLRYLLTWPKERAAELLSATRGHLARLFPVLERFCESSSPPAHTSTMEPSELRKLGFQALRTLLGKLAQDRPLVLCVDDLQWGDVDSALFLRDMFEPPNPSPLLLIASFREEDVEASEHLRIVRISAASPDACSSLREVNVGPLSEPEARDLALTLLGATHPDAESCAQLIADECLGSPFFVQQLVLRAQETGKLDSNSEGEARLSLEAVLRSRIQTMGDAAAKVLEIVSLAGIPISLRAAQRASHLGDEFHQVIATLRNASFLRSHGLRLENTVEPYHDRIRETVATAVPAERWIQRHRDLAEALEASKDFDPNNLAWHFSEAGDARKAWQYTVIAAGRAERALAFEQAANLYSLALKLQPDTRTAAVMVRLGEALAKAGRGAEAAQVYLDVIAAPQSKAGGQSPEAEAEAAETITDELREAMAINPLELRRRAAEQFLRSGYLDQGLAAVSVVLAAISMTFPPTPWRALLSLLLRRALLRMGGLRFHLRQERDIDPCNLQRIDACFTIATGLSNTDMIRGSDFNTRTLLMALKAGEPYRLLRALAMETIFVATRGTKARARADSLLAVTSDLCSDLDHLPLAKAWLLVANGLTDFFTGRFHPAFLHLTEAHAIFQAYSAGMAWELASLRYYLYQVVFYLGRVASLSREVPDILTEALDKGDLFCATNMRLSVFNSAWLVGDHLATARRHAAEASGAWSNEGFHTQHYSELLARAQLDLYEGKGKLAFDWMSSRWELLAKSMLLRVQVVRVFTLHTRARCALAAAGEETNASRRIALLDQASRDARRLSLEPADYAQPLSHLVLAGVASCSGDATAAKDHLERAALGFNANDMMLYAAVSRRCLGVLLGGDEGRALVQSASSWMTSETIKNADRWTAMLAPGVEPR